MQWLGTELLIRMHGGRVVCERYNQREMAEFMRERMIGHVERGETLVCFDGEPIEIAANAIERIDLVDPLGVEPR